MAGLAVASIAAPAPKNKDVLPKTVPGQKQPALMLFASAGVAAAEHPTAARSQSRGPAQKAAAPVLSKPAVPPAEAKPRPLTLEFARAAIVGVWNGLDGSCEGAVVSFDGQGRITYEGMGTDGGLLGFAANRSRYRLLPDPKGKGILLLRIVASGKEYPMYRIESMQAETAVLKPLEASLQSEDGKEMSAAKWKRVSREPMKPSGAR